MILCDTGPLVAAVIQSEGSHHSCVELFTGLRLARRKLMLPATVVAEVGYMLNALAGPTDESVFLRAIAEGDFEPVDLTVSDYARMAELVAQYDDFPLGTTDASVIAIAERLGIAEIATLDRRHFLAVRPNHIDHFRLLPERFT
jgi:predicted nucleic acid-binding protein